MEEIKNQKTNRIKSSDIKELSYIVNNQRYSVEKEAEYFYSYCQRNGINLLEPIDIDVDISKDETWRWGRYELNKLIERYKRLDEEGYFDRQKSPYKCNGTEFKERVESLKLAYETLKSNKSDYNKVELLIKLFESSEKFKKRYELFVQNGTDDEQLNIVREALNNIDLIYQYFKGMEEKGIATDINYVLDNIEYFQNYEYASFIIRSYINMPEAYDIYTFFEKLGIPEEKGKEILYFCERTIGELDPYLYDEYLEKEALNEQIKREKDSEAITELANAIRTKRFANGEKFNILEFTKRVPFKKGNRFSIAMLVHLEKYNCQEEETIIDYLKKNGMFTISPFEPLNYANLCSEEKKLHNKVIKKEDVDIVLEFLRLNEIPETNRTYIYVIDKYLNGEITEETMNKLREEKGKQKRIEATIIPSKKRN